MKKIGLKEIAEHVGVSAALVSYVLNGQAVEKQVNKETAERIELAAAQLNYRPNNIARSLKTKKSHTIGLVVADINYRFSTGITRAIEEEAKKHNYTVIYGSSNERTDKFAELINVFLNRRVDGLIIVPVENCENQILLLQRYEIPFVLVDRNFPGIKTNYIALDNFKASYTATNYLIDKGHKNICFVNYETTLYHLHERNRGFKVALKENGIKYKPGCLLEIPNDNRDEIYSNVKIAMDKMFKSKTPFDALFFATDTLASNGLKYLNELNIKVPDVLSVMSFDQSDAFELFYCSITHSRQPLEEMGKQAVNTLVELMDNMKVSKQVSLEADLIIGQSCKEV
nr:substrate-binding domain-containing protein [Pedobacter panaciterrae]